jgi:hypothetical protein
MENEFLNRVKLLSVYDTKKTLNENKIIISEQNDVTQLVRNFKNGQAGFRFARVRGLIEILNKIQNNNDFIKFFNGVNSETGKSLGRHINELLNSSDVNIANDISNLLKSKFGITVKSNGVENNTFVKRFQFPSGDNRSSWGLQPTTPEQSTTNSNDVNSNNQPKVIGYNSDGTEIYDNQQPEQQPEQQQRVVPQTFNDLLQGKGFLKLGDKSTAVKELQEKLISLGYGVSRATGYFGNETQKAVGEFQLLNKDKLKRDFAVGKDTGSVLNNAVQLRQRRNQQQTQPLPSVQRGVPQSNIQAPITGIKR